MDPTKLLFGLLFGQRIVRLAPLNVTTFFDQLTHLVRWKGLLALRTDIQRRGHQKIVAPSLSFG
jgi:hypothetical protein